MTTAEFISAIFLFYCIILLCLSYVGLCHVLLLIVFLLRRVKRIYRCWSYSIYVLLCFRHYTDVVPHAMQRLSIASEHYYEQ